MAQREIFDDAITTYLKQLIETNEESMRTLWLDFEKNNTNSPTTSPDGNKGKSIKVFTSPQKQLNYAPAVELNLLNQDNKIIAIGTQHAQYNYEIYTTVNNNHPELADRYIRIMSSAIQALLNDWERRSFQVPGYNFCTYYSEANNLSYGFRRGDGMISSRMTWMCKLFKPDRF
jgi:hypothetical protein